jgi:hypothetical protein
VSAQSKYGRIFAKYARIFGFDAYLPKVLSRSWAHIRVSAQSKYAPKYAPVEQVETDEI